MNKETTTKEYTIDATGKSLGRIATEAAVYLMGKNQTDFRRNKIPDVQVTIANASQTKISEKKKREKTYVHYTGYPGGKRENSLGHLLEKKGYETVFQKAVYGMLPANRLRALMMKNLVVED